MTKANQLFNENCDLIERFSYEVSTRNYPASALMPLAEIFLREAIRRFGNQSLQDFYYDAEKYVVKHLCYYIDTDGASMEWEEKRIKAAFRRKKLMLNRKCSD